jgi:hypothetical protein
LESLCLSSCEQDSGIGSHGATWAPANLGEQRTSRSVSSRARSPCAHEAASGASSGASSGKHAHGGRTSAEAGGGLAADGLSLECSSPTSGRAGGVLRGCRSPASGRAGGVRRRARYSGARLAAARHRAACCIHCSISPSSRDAQWCSCCASPWSHFVADECCQKRGLHLHGHVFGNSPTQRAQDFQAFTADTIQTFLGPSSSAGSASDPINVDIANNKRTDRAGGSGIELLESENTQEQLRTGQVNAHVLVLHVSWHNLLMRLIHLHVLCTGTDSLFFCLCSVMGRRRHGSPDAPP